MRRCIGDAAILVADMSEENVRLSNPAGLTEKISEGRVEPLIWSVNGYIDL